MTHFRYEANDTISPHETVTQSHARITRERTFGRWIWDKQAQRMVPADEYRARKFANVAVSDLPCPTVISDYVDVKSMVDGQTYTSKAALRRSYRERGYVEIGNEEQKLPPKPKPDRKAIRHAVRKAASQVGLPTC